MGRPPKVADDQIEEVYKRYRDGELIEELADEFRVCSATFFRRFRKLGLLYDATEDSRNFASDIRLFVKRGHSILYQTQSFNEVKVKVKKLQKEQGYKYDVAFLVVAKEYPCLWRLFRKFDVRPLDPFPDSHPEVYGTLKGCYPDIVNDNSDKKTEIVENKNKEGSHRENLNWAMNAAGEYLRTRNSPESCPNSAAYFLYQQAIQEPKDFLARFNQMETKTGNEQDPLKKSSSRSITEINLMLDTLNEEEGEEDEEKEEDEEEEDEKEEKEDEA